MIRVESVKYSLNDYDTVYDAIKHCVDELPSDNKPHICNLIYGSSYVIFAQKISYNDYASAFAISYNSQRPIYLLKVKGSWSQILLSGTNV